MIMRLTQPARTLAEVRPDVPWPNELQTVMSRALDREPDRRFASTRDFAHALHAAVVLMPTRATGGTRKLAIEAPSGEPATTLISSTPSKSTRLAPNERRRTLVIAAALAMVLVVVGAVGGGGALRSAHAATALKQGITAYRGGRRDLARERLQAAAQYAPNDPAPHVWLSRLARENNDLTGANTEAVKAVRLAPNSGPALRELATTLFATQNYSGARAFYARAIAADTTDHVSQGYLGCSLIQIGRTQEGLRWIRRAGSGTWSTCASTHADAAAP
jgi:cytochrome c-type biogenesis protein CcmH/NrfG